MAKAKTTKPKTKKKAKAKPKAKKDYAGPVPNIWTPLGGRPLGMGIGADVYGSQPAPGAFDLLQAFEDITFSCVTVISTSLGEEVPKFKLCVGTSPNDPQPKSLTKALDWSARKQIEATYRKQSRKAVDIREVTDHGILDLLDSPNPLHSFSKLVEMTAVYMELVGSAFWFIARVAGYPRELWLLPSHLITIELDDSGNVKKYVFNKGQTGETDYSPADVIHFRHVIDPLDPTGFGVSPLRAVWQRVQLLRQEQTSWQSILTNMAFPSALVHPPEGETFTDHQAERVAKQVTERFRFGNQGGIWVVQDGLQYEPVSPPPKDLSALSIYDSLKGSVCAAFRVPVPILDMSATSSETSDVSLRIFQRNCLAPRVNSILDTISHHLCPARMWLAADGIVQPDKVFELQKTTALVGGNILTVNEGRIAAGYEPKPGLDKLINQLVDVGTASAQTFQANAATVPVTKSKAPKRYRSAPADPGPMADALKRIFAEMSAKVLGSFKSSSIASENSSDPTFRAKAFLPLENWTQETARQLTPVFRAYYDQGSNAVVAALGGDDAVPLLPVLELNRSVQKAALAFAESTLETTELSVSEAVEATREAIRQGLDQGEASHQLTARIQEIFTDLSERRAVLIAETESNRAKHAGELIAIQAAGVEARKVWLADNMACDICSHLDGRSVELDKSFATIGTGPYSRIDHPPGHPGCRCSLTYEFDK